MYIVASSLMHVVFNGRLFFAAFCYFSVILFRAAVVYGEEVNLYQGHGMLFRAHNLSLHHLRDLPESVSADCPTYLCMGLHLTDSFSCTLPLSPVIPPMTRSLMLVSHCGEYMANRLTNAVRHEFVMIANDRQTFVAVRKHSRSFLWCFECYAGLTSGECMANGLTNAIRHQFAMIAK